VLRGGIAKELDLWGRESQRLFGSSHVRRAVVATGDAGGGSLVDNLFLFYIYNSDTM
jgi:hypothetical protein